MPIWFKNAIDFVVFDFDGVFTDNTVWVTQDTGIELVQCSRADGLGIALMHQAGVPMYVLSTEVNPVVEARCQKLGLEVEHGIADKGTRLKELLNERGIDPSRVAYVGNDVNDAGCLELVGTAVVVADAHPDVIGLADHVLSRSGGSGAVREFCDALLAQRDAEDSQAEVSPKRPSASSTFDANSFLSKRGAKSSRGRERKLPSGDTTLV
jgi:N-acylneuraminate cytidylyltransferase